MNAQIYEDAQNCTLQICTLSLIELCLVQLNHMRNLKIQVTDQWLKTEHIQLLVRERPDENKTYFISDPEFAGADGAGSSESVQHPQSSCSCGDP